MLAVVLGAGGCPRSLPSPQNHYASAVQVEENLADRTFVLGDNDRVALVKPADSNGDFMKLPFWLGLDVPVPGIDQPRLGHYYVISEARLVRPLDSQSLSSTEWLMEAGSSLFKKDAIFAPTRTRFRGPGRMLPMVVQFVEIRPVRLGGGIEAKLPVLKEVSLPAKWSLPGSIPKSYARFDVVP